MRLVHNFIALVLLFSCFLISNPIWGECKKYVKETERGVEVNLEENNILRPWYLFEQWNFSETFWQDDCPPGLKFPIEDKIYYDISKGKLTLIGILSKQEKDDVIKLSHVQESEAISKAIEGLSPDEKVSETRYIQGRYNNYRYVLKSLFDKAEFIRGIHAPAKILADNALLYLDILHNYYCIQSKNAEKLAREALGDEERKKLTLLHAEMQKRRNAIYQILEKLTMDGKVSFWALKGLIKDYKKEMLRYGEGIRDIQVANSLEVFLKSFEDYFKPSPGYIAKEQPLQLAAECAEGMLKVIIRPKVIAYGDTVEIRIKTYSEMAKAPGVKVLVKTSEGEFVMSEKKELRELVASQKKTEDGSSVIECKTDEHGENILIWQSPSQDTYNGHGSEVYSFKVTVRDWKDCMVDVKVKVVVER